jgi:hypothetical protein
MTIHADEFADKDMSRWIAEKADHTLEAACRLADWLRENELQLSTSDRQDIRLQLRAIIFDAAKLSAFGHENIQCWSGEWVDLMFEQGYDRYIEFHRHASREVSNDTPPAQLPLSIQNIIDLLNELEDIVESDTSDRTLARSRIARVADEFLKSKLETARQMGDGLKDLIDDQVVHMRISWDEFINECRTLIRKERDSLDKRRK